MASTLCTRMRLLVTVDNYNHTHEHLFEFGVQHAEIANFTIQRLRNPAVSDGGHGRRVMILESGTSIWSQSTFQTTRGSSPASSASTTVIFASLGIR